MGRVLSNPSCALPSIAHKKLASVVTKMSLSPKRLRQRPAPQRISAQRNPATSLQQNLKTVVAARIYVTMGMPSCLWQAQTCFQRPTNSTSMRREHLPVPVGCIERFIRRVSPISQTRVASRTERACFDIVHTVLRHEFAHNEAFVIQHNAGKLSVYVTRRIISDRTRLHN